MWSRARSRWRVPSSLSWLVGSLELCERCSRSLTIAVTLARRAHGDVKKDYEALVAAGELNFDPYQQRSVEQLQRLQQQLAGYEPPSSPSFLGKVRLTHFYTDQTFVT